LARGKKTRLKGILKEYLSIYIHFYAIMLPNRISYFVVFNFETFEQPCLNNPSFFLASVVGSIQDKNLFSVSSK
jgi:hypothetical protein